MPENCEKIRERQSGIRPHNSVRRLDKLDTARAAQLAEFNGELGRRLAALDQGEVVGPAQVRVMLQRKSEQRRKSGRVSAWVLTAAVEIDLDKIWEHIASEHDDADRWIESCSMLLKLSESLAQMSY